ncbi:MAG: hypothetical protein WCQ95_12895 [Bacteroidota bacterium]
METSMYEAKKKPNIFMYLSIVLLIACAFLTWKVISFTKQIDVVTAEKDSVSAEKDALVVKLETLKKQYDQLSKDNAQLTDMFNQEKEHVEKLLEKIRNSQGSVSKYKKQIASMEGRLKEYEVQLNELKNQNKDLRAENFHIKTVLDSTTTENKTLATHNEALTETVTKGSALTTYDINTDGIVVKAKGKEIPTKKAKKAEKIRVCFTIGENAIATAGAKTVYLRVADPSGTILTGGLGDELSFDYDGKKLQFSSKEQITYNNKAQDICIYWTKNKDFAPGSYTVDLFAEGNVIGTSTFVLEK